jgi:hypothetical protein
MSGQGSEEAVMFIHARAFYNLCDLRYDKHKPSMSASIKLDFS